MHLKQLKLAGFKSFVDLTQMFFPSQLVAVVGPNGCGKSNIIDAVRWVMGESSARNLRGESMTDVIFNGSSTRKSVGQASVELIFDNSLGRLAGPFSSYGEIAVKRVVTRDGDSSYYLNGGRCRRKDITDIFLGTGAGARGYSIIGQGTISQLIEARPEDLRGFLEEAAGVSKYKERRKETLQRIAHTRDNLVRITDIREELEKQLQRLERQAKAAEHYLLLKDKEQLCRAEILALKWQDLIRQQDIKQQELQSFALKYEQKQSELIKANRDRLILNEKFHDGEEQTLQIQADFYQLGTEIARLEEIIQQHHREKKRLQQDKQHMEEELGVSEKQLKQDKEELQQCQQNLYHLSEQVLQLQIQFTEQDKKWQSTQQQQEYWNNCWQEAQIKTNTLKREFQVAQINMHHIEQKQQQVVIKLEKLKLEQDTSSINELQQHKKDLEEVRVRLITKQQTDELELKNRQEQSHQLRSIVQETEQKLHHLQDDFYRKNSEHAALMAAQQAARQGTQSEKRKINAWFDKPRLMDILQVEPKWQWACELILNETLHAYVLENMSELWSQRDACEHAGQHVVIVRNSSEERLSRPRLVDKIQGKIPACTHSLEHIYIAEHFDEAFDWWPDLLEYQSIVTPDGFWLGKGWAKFAPLPEQEELGLLTRQQKITDLSLIVEELQQKIEALKIQRDHTHQQLQKNLDAVELQQTTVNSSNEALRNNQAALITKEQAILSAEKQAVFWAQECETLQIALEETAEEHFKIKAQLQDLEHQCHFDESQQEHYKDEKQKCLDALHMQGGQLEKIRVALHQAELEDDREKNKIQQLSDRIHKDQARINLQQERLNHLLLLCVQAEDPQNGYKEQLDQQLMKHGEVELHLTMRREQLGQLRYELEELERTILKSDGAVKEIQELLSKARMEEQALSVRACSIQESLDESDLQANTLLEHLSKDITQRVREEELIALTEKIKRLGAINLAAIEEYTTEQQRKLYLDEQYEDLSEALSILETAIEKMDKETRLRLENTFSAVNAAFKAIFPRLFGGGKAQLELTCENLLEAGIVVMAQPPGKRNSTIHLLSGGEKAMTAVALVFAIFQLNPSPFCMLDEVDAPLDDVNVGRFCALVKEMSQFVQFLFITHNKVTMELADHLIGVTMREPGVSRLVAVDVTQALVME